jgi:hypothetical protein
VKDLFMFALNLVTFDHDMAMSYTYRSRHIMSAASYDVMHNGPMNPAAFHGGCIVCILLMQLGNHLSC